MNNITTRGTKIFTKPTNVNRLRRKAARQVAPYRPYIFNAKKSRKGFSAGSRRATPETSAQRERLGSGGKILT